MQASEVVQTIKIEPSHKSQGEFVEINADDFDASKHKKFGEAAPAEIPASAEKPVPPPRAKARRKKG